MSFNKIKKSVVEKKLNHEGQEVFKLNALQDIFSKVLGSYFGESTYYETRDNEEELKKLKALVDLVQDRDMEYVLKIAAIGRKFNMIQYPINLLGLCANDNRVKGNHWVRNYGEHIIQRTKDITDLMAFQLSLFGRPIPAGMRKLLRTKLEYYDDYKLSKGLGENKSVSLADCIKLLRPRPFKDRQTFKQIIEGNLTFGAGRKQVQALGKKTESKVDRGIIIGSTQQATVKNLKALYERGAFEDEYILDEACKMIEKDATRLLPYRFYSAFQELNINDKVCNKLKTSLIKAINKSIDNLPTISGNTAVLIDVSGSMGARISHESKVHVAEIASLLGGILYKKSEGDLFTFASSAKKINLSKECPLFDMMEHIFSQSVGGLTNLDYALGLIEGQSKINRRNYDNLIILTDGDIYSVRQEQLRLDARGVYRGFKNIWINNLLGNDYTIVNLKTKNMNLITGFSEKIVNMIDIYQRSEDVQDVKKLIDELYKQNYRG